ncbi:hypothetical protein F4780DRAFT_270372 [Xylariomycetidae sp. FL0641]|nr:hypothetical protein F4780DRAFT_270372 [Xylariomycetidae sp. FL0641]
MASLKAIMTLSLLGLVQLAAGHSAITSAKGNLGGSGMALGVNLLTPRDGTDRRPFQEDSTRFRGRTRDTVGETIGAGDNDAEEGTKAILLQNGGDKLPQVSAGGVLTMTLHQVNSDGAGPYECMINTDGTGEEWEDIEVTTSPPGDDSRDRDGEMTDFPLVAAIPADQTCEGDVAGQSNVCLVRCQNDAAAGPFGGVVPVQLPPNATAPANARRDASAATRRNVVNLTRMMKRGLRA